MVTKGKIYMKEFTIYLLFLGAEDDENLFLKNKYQKISYFVIVCPLSKTYNFLEHFFFPVNIYFPESITSFSFLKNPREKVELGVGRIFFRGLSNNASILPPPILPQSKMYFNRKMLTRIQNTYHGFPISFLHW
jgi:hypothetical protein